MVQSLQQLQAILQSVTKDITELPGKQVRIAFQQQGQPARTIGQDVIYLTVAQVDNPYDKQLETDFDADYSLLASYYTRVMECTWMCYGPNSFDYADQIRWGILQMAARNTLRSEQIFPVTGINSPLRVPYLFDGQWWERSDLKVQLYVLTERHITTEAFNAASIELYDEDGLERVAYIDQ